MNWRIIRTGALLAAATLAACGRSSDGAVEIALIAGPEEPFAQGVRISPAAQPVRAAVMEGLVGLDENGEVIPGLADRWIVTDDGRSYIFRLREGNWSDGEDLTGESARDALRRVIRALAGTSLGLDLAPIDDIRTMAGRVVEIRLSSPVPSLLQLLAQPELALPRKEGMGPMILERDGDQAVLKFLSPEKRGLPSQSNWEDHVRPLHLSALPATEAVNRFYDGQLDLVLNGTIVDFPLVDTGPLSRGTARLDPALGLFGLQVVETDGFLASPYRREALAMAIDRAALASRINIGGWVPTNRLVPSGLPGDTGQVGQRWQGTGIDEMRGDARRRVADWVAGEGKGQKPLLRIALPKGKGSDMLFERVGADFGAIGINTQRVGMGDDADLRLFDKVARYAGPQWFLNQFNCRINHNICSERADSMLREANAESDPKANADLLVDAEVELTTANIFIPFGPPIRWSLVRGSTTGFGANRWAFHPLPPLAVIPK